MFEEFWRMPIREEHRRGMKNSVADLRNSDTDSAFGGSCKAAAFLNEFVEEGVKWCHLDVAGPAFRKSAKAPLCAQATGFGVQTFLCLLIERSK